MAGRLNKLQLIGHLTRDPEIRYVDNTRAVAKFGLAVNRKTKQRTETLFIDVVAWERLGETVNTYLKKGMSVYVEGRLVIRDYENRDGEQRRATEVIANDVQMLERPKLEGNGPQQTVAASAHGGHDDYDEELDDELPF